MGVPLDLLYSYSGMPGDNLVQSGMFAFILQEKTFDCNIVLVLILNILNLPDRPHDEKNLN